MEFHLTLQESLRKAKVQYTDNYIVRTVFEMKAKGDSTKMVFELALGAIFAALVCVTTLVFTLSVPATSGYFNVGETVIYVAALLFGPIVGAFAGGVGAAIADMLVAPRFALGTLFVKGCEGTIVGFLNGKFRQTSKSDWKLFTALLGTIVGLLLALTGSLYLSGRAELYLGIPPPETPTAVIFVPAETWYLLGGAVVLLIVFMGFRIEPESGRAVFSMILGGLEMVAGYFLYERLVLGEVSAIIEIPINIGQMIVGLVVAIPITRIVRRSLPQLRN
jgi:uncharacterized membrane protein